jgi:hypothetical protein
MPFSLRKRFQHFVFATEIYIIYISFLFKGVGFFFGKDRVREIVSSARFLFFKNSEQKGFFDLFNQMCTIEKQ